MTRRSIGSVVLTMLALGPAAGCSDESTDPLVGSGGGGTAGAAGSTSSATGGGGGGPACEAAPPPAAALLDGAWDAAFVLPGLNGEAPGVLTTTLGASGELYAGGLFSFGGTASARNIASWTTDGGWAALGEGLTGAVTASAVAPDGALWVATSDWEDDFSAYWHTIHRWDGGWEPIAIVTLPPDLAEPQRHGIQRMVFDTAGDLVVAGDFTAIDGAPVVGLAALGAAGWDGLAANPDGPVFALQSEGDVLCVGGAFASIGGVQASRVACLEDGVWTALDLDEHFGGGFVRALARSTDGELYAAGYFNLTDPVTNDGGSVGRWDGETWQLVDRGVGIWDAFNQVNTPGLVRDIAWVGDDLVVAGSFYNAGGTSSEGEPTADVEHLAGIRRGRGWEDAGRAPLALGVAYAGDNVFSLATDGNDLYAGGIFSAIGDSTAYNVARRAGSSWSPLEHPGDSSLGVEGAVNAFASRPCDLYVAGRFARAGGVAASSVARFTPAGGFEALGPGFEGEVTALAIHPQTGDLYAAELVCVQMPDFLDCAQTRVQRWDGVAWSTFAATSPGALFRVAFGADGSLYGAGTVVDAEGAGNVVLWSGAAWEPLGGGTNGPALALLIEDDNSVIVGGIFDAAGGVSAQNVARWDGTGWTALGEGLDSPVATVARAGDRLVAGTQKSFGADPSAALVAAWDGAAWTNIGTALERGAPNPQIHEIVVGPGYLVAVGQFPFFGGVALLENDAWTVLGDTNQFVQSAILRPEGLYVAGGFSLVAGQPSVGLGRLPGR